MKTLMIFSLFTLLLSACATVQAPQATATPERLSDQLGETPTPAGTGESAQPQPEIRWDTRPEAVIITATNCCGLIGNPVRLNYIPDAALFGDGLLVWVQYESNGPRHVWEARLNQDQMTALLQRFADQGFFGWKDLYMDPMSPTDMPNKCININLSGQSKSVCEYYKGAPQVFHDLYAELNSGVGQAGKDYTPLKGYLTAQPIDLTGSQPEGVSPWDVPGSSFTLDQAIQGAWIEGPALEAAWKAVNSHPISPVVQEGDKYYILTVQLAGLSQTAPPNP